MVVFTCQHCGESLRKPKVDKHYNSKCKFKTPSLTCVDCLRDFIDQEFTAHTECVSEAERYSAKGTVIKEYVGKNKQARYIGMIQNLLKSTNLSTVQKQLLQACSTFDNVPRKLNKFKNFMRNVARSVIYNDEDLNSVFKILEDAWQNEVQSTNVMTKNQEKEVESVAEEALKVSGNENGDAQEDLSVMHNSVNNKCESNQIKKNKFNDESHSSIAEVEMLIENDCGIEETKENINGVSKKKLKKQKKYEKYMAELANEAKYEENENVQHSEILNDSHKKSKKKSKNSKTDQESSDLSQCYRNDNSKSTNVKEVVHLPERNHKRNKKRKIDDSICDTAEKRQKGVPVGVDEELNKPPAVFDWADVILRVLQSRPDKELSLKRLAKKTIYEYQTVKSDHRTYEELLAKFNKKVKKTVGVRVLKDKAKLIE